MVAGPMYARYRPPSSRPDTTKSADPDLLIKANKQAKQSPDKPKFTGNASSEQHESASGVVSVHATSEKQSISRPTKKRKRETHGAEQPEAEQDVQKNSNVLKKYHKATALRVAEDLSITVPSNGDQAVEVVLHDLVPLPQPAPAPQGSTISVSSALPVWLSKPKLVSATSAAPFKSLGVDAEHLAHLSHYPEALAVQTGVLPLLLPRASQHPGDLCVSAATGSGKTLAYVLPIVQSIKNRVCTRMRAIIVVPTRELVGQVERTARECAIGTNLHVGVATGSQALTSEQVNLISKDRTHDPESYHNLLKNLDDIARLDSDILVEDADEQRLLEDGEDLWPGFVPVYNSKVDILVCTPGRLVDHIKSTHGFSLADLEWLVIDEADRLLDQSFQEWADVVNEAIDQRENSETTTKPKAWPSFTTLRSPKPRVRKVILSATMTRDLDRLALIKLWNPKLVLMEGIEHSMDNSNGTALEGASAMSLPPYLHECAVPVSTGADKPLYLLQILLGALESPETLTSTGESRSMRKRTESVCEPVSSSDPSDGTDSSISDDMSSDSASESESSEAESTTSSEGSPNAKEENASHVPDMLAKQTLNDHFQTAPAPAAPKILIFTSSTESADRLTHLLSHLHPPCSSILDTLTKSSSAGSRATLAALRSGRKRILIATDRASRGLDVPDITQVINYDMPHSVTSYVHRVGRTARAGKSGEAWTLVEDREAGWFWNAIAKSPEIGRGDQKVARVRVESNGQAFGQEMRRRYAEALQLLERDVKDTAGRSGRS